MNESHPCALAYTRRESGGIITSILLFVSGSPWTASTLIIAYQTLSAISQRLYKYFFMSHRNWKYYEVLSYDYNI